MEITHPKTQFEIEDIRMLFQEYAAFLGVDLCFQGFKEELAGLPGKYAAPGGALLMAKEGEFTAGCVALRRLDQTTCEMKRLFVRPKFQGQKIGRLLAERIIIEGMRLGYKSMRLDTLDTLQTALKLYAALGFKPIDPYYHNPFPNVVYLQLDFDGLTAS